VDRNLGFEIEAGDPEVMIRNSGFWPALLLGCFLFTYQLGAVPLFDLDEAIYAETAREMVETGDWLTPQFNYSPDFDKPILLYWFMAAAMKTFGPSEFSARLVSAVFGMFLLMVTYGFTRSVRTAGSGLLAMLILASSLEMVVLSHAAMTDMLLVFFITAALASYYMLYKTDRGFWSVGLYLSLALAVLTKGPVGLVLPGSIIALFIMTVGPWPERIRQLRLGWGILIFSVVALPWYGIMFGLHGSVFWNSFFLRHNVERFTSALGGHAGSPFYYLGILAVGFFPWAAFLPASVIALLPGRNFSERCKRFRRMPSEKPFEWFLWLWVGVVFGFFTLAGTKLPNYIAPAFPAMAILVAGWWDRKMEKENTVTTRGDRFTFGLLGLLTVVFAAVLLTVPKGIEWARMKYGASAPFLAQPIELGGVLMILSSILLIGATTFHALYRLTSRRMGFMVLVLMMGSFVFVLLFELVPSVSGYIQMPLRDLARQTGGWIHPDEPLILFGLKKPSILFYARRGATLIKSNQEEILREFLTADRRAVVLSDIHSLPVLNTIPHLFIREEKGGYVLATRF
jgi:4-amino-4-deoxy-L-arabinose transferase-like glycosyltransferase